MTYFRQFRDESSGACAYLIGCTAGRCAVIIDPQPGQLDLYRGVVAELQLQLEWIVETHDHPRHSGAADELRQGTTARIARSYHAASAVAADRQLRHGDRLQVGDIELETIETPGHTGSCLTFRWEDRLFTGDCLLIGNCGNTDAADASAALLYDSITRRLFAFPDETLIYPAHCDGDRCVGCIGAERRSNPELHGIGRDEFIARRREAGRRQRTQPTQPPNAGAWHVE